MKLSSIAIPTALAILTQAQETPEFKSFDKAQLASGSFLEQFDSDDWAQLWKISQAKKDDEFNYVGEWDVEETIIFPGFKGDKGLVLKTKAAHHAIHAPLAEPFDNKDNTLVLQYEVKLQEGLNCGGAYVKLLSADGGPDAENEFNNDSPYQVMFGPDKCGTTNKVHLIIKRKNPHTGEYEEKHLQVPPLARTVKTTTLYTLIIKPDQDFEIRINGEVVKAGNLLEEDTFQPPFDPPTEIEDPEDTQPEDWDDRPQIPDPDQTEKPEDWDERAPYMIPDPNAVKPESWDESIQQYIPDPESEKPEDWDDEEDGEWVAPLITNPECEHHGCGKWIPEMVPNPEYKGKWTQPYIENPDYKGEWYPRKIANPSWFQDSRPSDLEPIGAIGFELWSMDKDILFDNIYFGHSIDDAQLLGNETWKPKFDLEQEAVLNVAKEAKKPEGTEQVTEEDVENILENVVSKLKIFVDDAQDYVRDFLEDPLNTLSSRPAEAGIYASTAIAIASFVLMTISLFVSLFASASDVQRAANVEKKEEIEQDVKVSSGETSGALKGETEAVKRG
jgi:calnexin